MAKALIIKGADFSAVAVDHIITEPQEYTELAFIGTTWNDASRVEGAIALFVQSGSYEFDKIVNGSAVTYTFPDGSIVKYQGNYYTTKSSKYLLPYYGVKSVETSWVSGGYKLADGEMTEVSGSDFKRMSIDVHAGERYVFLLYGAASTTTIIKEVDGVYTSFADNSTTAGIYRNVEIDEDCTLHLSNYVTKCKTPTIAKVKS
jgi:hypothetical protein